MGLVKIGDAHVADEPSFILWLEHTGTVRSRARDGSTGGSNSRRSDRRAGVARRVSLRDSTDVEFERYIRMANNSNATVSAEEELVFTASRVTKGNGMLPVRIVLNRHRVAKIKMSSLFSTEEESIAIQNVTSVKTIRGLMWSDIQIESTGGSSPITSHGHTAGDAKKIRSLIEQYQRESQ